MTVLDLPDHLEAGAAAEVIRLGQRPRASTRTPRCRRRGPRTRRRPQARSAPRGGVRRPSARRAPSRAAGAEEKSQEALEVVALAELVALLPREAVGVRYYNPVTGRYISKDPMGMHVSLNGYTYVGNNPINRIDPLGLSWGAFWSSLGSTLAVGVGIVAAVTLAVVLAPIVLPAAAAAAVVNTISVVVTAVAVVGAVSTAESGYGAVTGREAYTGRKLSDDERSAAAGSAVGGVLAFAAGAGAARGVAAVARGIRGPAAGAPEPAPVPEVPPAAETPPETPVETEEPSNVTSEPTTAAGGNDDAVGLRDELSARMKDAVPRPATVVAGTNVKTGESVAAASGEDGCAENNVERALGCSIGDIVFTNAVRPRSGAPVGVCPRCEYRYGRGAFPSDAIFQSDKIKLPRAPKPPSGDSPKAPDSTSESGTDSGSGGDASD